MQRPSDEALSYVLDEYLEPGKDPDGYAYVYATFYGNCDQGTAMDAVRNLYDELKQVMDEIEAYDARLRQRRAWEETAGAGR